MGKSGKLVQIAGYTFELGHEIEMLATQTLAHLTGSKSVGGGLPCVAVRQHGPTLAGVVYAPYRAGGLCGILVFGLCPTADVRLYDWSVS